MRIKLVINTESLGENSHSDNMRYTAAVANQIERTFPEADVSVKLGDFDLLVTDSEDEDAAQVINEIASDVWQNNLYWEDA